MFGPHGGWATVHVLLVDGFVRLFAAKRLIGWLTSTSTTARRLRASGDLPERCICHEHKSTCDCRGEL